MKNLKSRFIGIVLAFIFLMTCVVGIAKSSVKNFASADETFDVPVTVAFSYPNLNYFINLISDIKKDLLNDGEDAYLFVDFPFDEADVNDQKESIIQASTFADILIAVTFDRDEIANELYMAAYKGIKILVYGNYNDLYPKGIKYFCYSYYFLGWKYAENMIEAGLTDNSVVHIYLEASGDTLLDNASDFYVGLTQRLTDEGINCYSDNFEIIKYFDAMDAYYKTIDAIYNQPPEIDEIIVYNGNAAVQIVGAYLDSGYHESNHGTAIRTVPVEFEPDEPIVINTYSSSNNIAHKIADGVRDSANGDKSDESIDYEGDEIILLFTLGITKYMSNEV